MIGFLTQPTGRLGNVLLQYLFLREVSYYTNVPFFHAELKGNQYFEELEETVNFSSIKRKFFGKKKIDNSVINNMGIEKFTEYVCESEKNIILTPPVLGHTFETMYVNPNMFLKVREELKKEYFNYQNKIVIALHFRGTDFAAWNPMACLDSQYYIDAINYCVQHYDNKKLFFSFFTDDTTIDSYQNALEYVREKKLAYHEGNAKRNLGEECYNISISDIVVSSPSTFAIAASLIGKKKKIIHSKKWCDYCREKEDRVWVQMLQNKCEFYQIEIEL